MLLSGLNQVIVQAYGIKESVPAFLLKVHPPCLLVLHKPFSMGHLFPRFTRLPSGFQFTSFTRSMFRPPLMSGYSIQSYKLLSKFVEPFLTCLLRGPVGVCLLCFLKYSTGQWLYRGCPCSFFYCQCQITGR